MSLLLIPDPARLVSAFLRVQPEVSRLVDDRVYTVLPAKVTFPAVRIVQWTERPVIERPLWLVTPGCQVDCWAHAKYEASTLARTLRAVLADRLAGAAAGAVTGVGFGNMADTPDTDYEPALARFRFDLFVTLHPLRSDAPAGFTRDPDAPDRLSA